MIPVFITTYERPESCYDLLLQLSEEDRAHGGLFKVFVVADHCEDDYKFARDLCAHLGWRFDMATRHHGMELYAVLLNRFASYMRFSDAPFFLFLQDDVGLAKNFWSKIKTVMTEISDERFGCLNLHVDRARKDDFAGPAKWTEFVAEKHETYDKLGWFDLPAFVGSREMFECVGFSVPRVESWTSSGVPCAWSRALIDAGLGIYRTRKSLVRHRDMVSKMHPDTNEFLSKCSQTVCFDRS